MMTRIYNKFMEAMIYEFTNRYSSINDINYGNPKPIKSSIQLSKDDVFKIAQRILIECIELYLPKRTIQSQTEVDTVFDESVDKTSSVLQRRESDVIINPKDSVVTVTKKKAIQTKEIELENKIMEEVPKELPMPVFSTPNPIKSKTKTLVKQGKVISGGGRNTLMNYIK